MSIPKWLQIGHDQVFSLGAFLVSEVTPMIDFDKSSGENRVQARDRDTGLPMWQVEVLDGDPAAPKRSRTVTIKFAAATQPTAPTNSSGTPFTPVVLEGLMALPYVERSGDFSRIAWSYRASGMTAPGKSPAANTNKASA
ncbi:plasmid replication, integration and excision activator [Mycobacterium sp. TNTM28]|uniref:Plasmid replication, integration and excision activator n=1 Tax=[Mycobacterium] fortunisiensis TaxID=2600579 RepID=A0ABS6KIE0_9MYCO|nr:plasmid replication, integration and excision activator [[Mycobacterium] fortunisiensis]MBU9763268.1 plasmid replication, integration and excision activator [[Mycobacterium] fortunisiensis]